MVQKVTSLLVLFILPSFFPLFYGLLPPFLKGHRDPCFGLLDHSLPLM